MMKSIPWKIGKQRFLLNRIFFSLIVIMMLVSSGCNLPVITHTATPTAQSATPIAVAVAKPLPAAVVETDPLPNSDLAANGVVTVFFNQPMQRSSVEGALHTEPALAGKFEWPDDSTMRFIPDKPLPPDTVLTVSFEKSATAANGLGMPDPVSFQYQTSPFLSATERLPRPESTDVDPTSAIVATFNLPVVPLGETTSSPEAFTITPAVEGRGEWLNTSAYIFYPEPALQGGVKYSVALNPDLTSQSGSSFSTDAILNWSFSTALPSLVNLEPASGSIIGLDAPITLTFNQPINRSSVEGAFQFSPQGGSPIAGSFTWSDDSSSVTYQPAALLDRDINYTLQLSKQATGLGGTPLNSTVDATYRSVPALSVVKTDPVQNGNLQNYGGYGGLSITFTSPLSQKQDFTELVKFDPSISENYFYSSDRSLNISGYFAPSQEYTLTLSAELKDQWGMQLGQDYTLKFSTKDSQPVLSIPIVQSTGSRVVFLTPNDTLLAANATNLLSLDIRSGKMDELNFIAATLGNVSPSKETRWQQTLNLEANRNQTIGIELTPNGQSLKPGLYAFSVSSPQIRGNNTSSNDFLAVSSRIQLTLKESIDEMLVWAVDLDKNQPVNGLKIHIYDQNQTEVGNSDTDENGLATIPLSPKRQIYDYLFAISGKPGDDDFSLAVTNWSAGINSWDYGISTSIQQPKPGIYLYTDRPIYRPGQTVFLRGIVRTPSNGRYKLPPEQNYSVTLVSPYDPLTGNTSTIEQQSKALTAFGTFSMSFTLPENTTPGQYHFEVPGMDSYLYFQVANYRKPEMEVKVAFTQAEILAGANLHATVDANYYFGAPAGNLPINWTLSRRTSSFYLPGGYQVGPMDTSWLNAYYNYPYNFDQIILSGQANTDASGKFSLTITPDQLASLNPTTLQDLTLEATITDPSNQPVSGRGSMRLLPAEFAIGIQPEAWSSQTGDELGFSIITVDWDQQVKGNIPLTAQFQKITWKQKYNAEIGEFSSKPEYTSVGSTDFVSGADGQARIAFTPTQPGVYQVEVSNENAVSQAWVWVSGAGSAPWPQLPNQRLRLSPDAQTYEPGQTARIFIPNPFSSGALALITVERAKVMHSEVVTLSGSGLDYELPLTEDYAPTVYVAVTILGNTGEFFDFRQGYTEIKVDPSALILDVKLTGEPKQARPGENLTLNLDVKDSTGKPVQGEFSLALIDKAVLALADPNSTSIMDAYYGDQPLGVETSLSLAAYGQRPLAIPPGRGGGGGGGDMGIPPSVREEFRDTAFWNGEVVTDANGRAQISLALPDNVTTWVGMVRGISKDSLVGETELEIIATRDLLVRPVTPRFLVAGDHLEMAAVVNNNTAQNLSVDVSLQPTGFVLDEPAKAVQSIQVAAGAQQRVAWWGTVGPYQEADLVFGAQAGGLQDFARPTWGKLPILNFTAPQTFGTAGVLYDAGDRLETVSLPRSFTARSGELQIELTPSLAATVLSDLTIIEQNRFDFTEALISRILPNLETYRALKDLGISNSVLENQLSTQVTADLPKLLARQKSDGGWGWDATSLSDPQISIYAVWALIRAREAGFDVSSNVFNNGVQYLQASLMTPEMSSEDFQLDRLAFQHFVLAEAGQTAQEPQALLPFRSRLNPWAKAMLAMTLNRLDPGNADTATLLSDLQATALRSATGVNWQDAVEYRQNFISRNLSTAIVTYALARLDPASPLLVDATRYLITNRKEIGGWSTSYESAWVITALIETMKGTGDLQANFSFGATLNGAPLASGVAGGVNALNPVRANVPLSQLLSVPNELLISRQTGNGRLYYRAYLQVNRPAQDAKPVSRGMTLERRYYQANGNCKLPDCPEVTSVRLQADTTVWVRLSLTVPSDQYYAVVEDWLPAGAEVLDLSLKTSQQNQTNQVVGPQYNPRNPFSQGWGWWYFGDPQIGDENVTWVAPYLPAGTYELTYQLVPIASGEFQVLPAHAFIYYFPEVEATSAGSLLTIAP